MNWSFRDKTITLTEIEVDSDENGELESCTKETEEGEKKMDKNESFKQAFEQNKTFYQKAKNRLRKDYCGQYVIIGAGQLLDVQDTYDLAIEKANKLKQKLLHVMIFRADEEPLLGTIKFGIRSTRGYPEN